MAASYKELVVWKKAMELARLVYEMTATFPSTEKYGLVSQMRRAAVSVPSNIAEGQGRSTAGEFRQFLGNARGSLYELETQSILAEDLGWLSGDDASSMRVRVETIGKLLNGLMRSLRAGPDTKQTRSDDKKR